jgi:hypothetical protein
MNLPWASPFIAKLYLGLIEANPHAITNLPCYRISTVTEVSCVFPSHLKKAENS